MSKGHRIFIAINLPEETKRELSGYQSKWPELPARWTKKDNLHITLAFLGYIKDEDISDISKIVKEAAAKHKPFSMSLNKISYGPPKKIPPRMIWAIGAESEELDGLQKHLENAFSGKISESGEARAYAFHITLARIKQWEFRVVEPEERPEVSEDISLNFEAKSIEIMESKLKQGGPDYFVLESIELGEK